MKKYITLQNFFILVTSATILYGLTDLLLAYHPIIGKWIASKLAPLRTIWLSFISSNFITSFLATLTVVKIFIASFTPKWASFFFAKLIKITKRHGLKVIAVKIITKLLSKKLKIPAKVVAEKTVLRLTEHNKFQMRLVALLFKWEVFKYHPPKERRSWINRKLCFLHKTIIKLLAIVLSILFAISFIIFLGDSALMKMISAVIKYLLEIDLVQKNIIKGLGVGWVDKITDRIYKITLIQKVLDYASIFFLKIMSFIPFIGKLNKETLAKESKEPVSLKKRRSPPRTSEEKRRLFDYAKRY